MNIWRPFLSSVASAVMLSVAMAVPRIGLAECGDSGDAALKQAMQGARSARQLEAPPTQRQQALEQALQAMKPHRPERSLTARKLQALLLTDLNRSPEAIELLEPLLAQCPKDAELWRIRGYAAHAHRDWLDSLRAYGRSLQLEPANAEARAAMGEALGVLGSPHGQSLWVDTQPLDLQAAIAGRDVRWGGQVWPREAARRHDDTDRGLGRLDVVVERARQGLPATADVLTRAQMDRALALSQRQRPVETLAQIDELRQRGVGLPLWLQSIEGSALLRLRRPEEAARVWDAVLKAEPLHDDARVGRIYAAVEMEDWGDAFARVDALVASADSPARQLEAATFAAQLRSWADLQGQAWDAISPLADQVPANAGMRLTRANIAAARGWTRLADEEIDIAASFRTVNRDASLASAESDLRLGRYAQAREGADALWIDGSDNTAVQRLRRDVRVAEGGESDLQVGFDRGDPNTANAPSNSHMLRWRLRSPKLEPSARWRLLAGFDQDRSRPLEGDITRQLTGVGVGWLTPVLQMQVWGWHREGGAARDGTSASAFWQATDRWGFVASHAVNASQTPVRAERSGINGDHTAFTAQYRWHESLSLTGDVARLDYSDGNRSDSVTLHAQWKAWAQPLKSITLRPYLSHTSNSRPGGPYFAPRSADSISTDVQYEQILWRSYERSYVHRLTATAGRYLQADHGNLPMTALRYEQTWQSAPWTELVWGIHWSRRPYDGVQEHGSGLYARWIQKF